MQSNSSVKVSEEREQSLEEVLDFDNNTLRAIAEVYKNKGNEEYRKKQYSNAIHFYTEGIKLNCGDKELDAKLYNNRATAHFYLGNYQESRNDAKAAIGLQPNYVKAIAKGASACFELGLNEEAIALCDKGLAIEKNHKPLLEIRMKSMDAQEKTKERQTLEEQESVNPQLKITDSMICSHERRLQNAKETGDRAEEGRMCGWFGHAYYNLGEFETAISYFQQFLNLSEDVNDRLVQGGVAFNLGNAYFKLGDFTRAINSYERYFAFKVESELSKTVERIVFDQLGECYYELGSFRKAIFYYERCLKIAQEVGDSSSEAQVLGSIGSAYSTLGDVQQAIGYHERSLKIAIATKNKTREGNAYGDLGNDYYFLGNFVTAVYYHECHLKIAKEMEDKYSQARAYCNLGNSYCRLGYLTKALECHMKDLEIANLTKDRSGQALAYDNIGGDYFCLGEFKKAIDYQKRSLEIARELKNKYVESNVYGNLGTVYFRLGDCKKAIEFHENRLEIARELEDKSGEGNAYGSIGNVYFKLRDFPKAKANYELRLKSAQALRDKAGEGRAYFYLGNVYWVLEDATKAIDYFERSLQISKEVEEKALEGKAYGSLGNAYATIGDVEKGRDYAELELKIAKEVNDMVEVGDAYQNLGRIYESTNSLQEALECFQASIKACNTVRGRLQSEDDWKISLREVHHDKYTSLCRVLLKLDRSLEALCAAEQGRAQSLKDLLKSHYGIETIVTDRNSRVEEETTDEILRDIPCNTIFLAFQERVIITWVIQNDRKVYRREKEVGNLNTLDDIINSVKRLVDSTFDVIGVRASVRCEDRSLDEQRSPSPALAQISSYDTTSLLSQEHPLSSLYDVIIDQIADLIHGDEIIIVPEGPLWLVPYAALMDSNSRFLFESFRIRVTPSLAALKMIIDRPADHCEASALLVGNPWVQEVILPSGKKLEELPSAEEEVETIGKIIRVTPLTGKDATKNEVLKRLSSVCLVHFAAHGRVETGEIALSPNPSRASKIPEEEDYLLTMQDVMSAKLQARLVVLSCCHSGRGEIMAEGVVGIARAFLGAGARSVLVALWAIDDEATLEFMNYFYQQLVKGESASECLNRAMKCMREADHFNEVKYWAPFVLIGDDVTLEFTDSD